MILLHEQLPVEARAIAKELTGAFRIPVQVRRVDCGDLFKHIPERNGHIWRERRTERILEHMFPKVATLILTPRDLLYSRRPDDWYFGYATQGTQYVVSTARMRGGGSEHIPHLAVRPEIYLRRLQSTAIHELGHHLVTGKHLRKTFWIDGRTGARTWLGYHCPDSTCVMYESVSNETPSPAEGYLLIGGKKRFDAGTDELLRRRRPDWFCDACRQSMEVTDEYLRTLVLGPFFECRRNLALAPPAQIF